jgi:hypothetical protein
MSTALTPNNDLSQIIIDKKLPEYYHKTINDHPALNKENEKTAPFFGQVEDFRNHLFTIEYFVKNVIDSDIPGFLWHSKRERGDRAIPTILARAYYKHLSQQREPPALDHRFSEHIELYFTSAHEIGFPSQVYGGPDTLLPAPDIRNDEGALQDAKPGKRLGDLFNDLIDRIRTAGRSKVFQEKLRKRKESAAGNFPSACRYVDVLFKHRTRMLVLRLEFGYLENLAQGITVEQARQDLQRLLRNKRHNKLFSTEIGYIWKLEEGIQRGPHFHVFIFLDGSLSRHHMYLAEMIGRYWRDSITKGRGTFHNCNRKKYKYRAIGMIKHDEMELIDNLKHKAIYYLTKQDQFSRIKSGRTFGKGKPPKLPDVKLGRPRVK